MARNEETPKSIHELATGPEALRHSIRIRRILVDLWTDCLLSIMSSD